MSILDVGGGAAEGLETLLKRHREEELLRQRQQQINETSRSNQADETYRRDALGENVKLRELAERDRTATAGQVEQNRVRDDVRAKYGTLPMSTIIEPGTMQKDVATGGIAQERFDTDAVTPDRQAMAEGVPESLAQNESVIKLRGTPQELASQATREATAASRAQTDADRDASRTATADYRKTMTGLAGQREQRLNDWGPPTVVIADPNSPGGAKVIPRNQLGPTGDPAPVPPALRSQEVSSEVGLDQLDRLEQMFESEGGKDVVGPIEGRARSIGQQIPGVPVNEQFSNLEAATAAFRNATIKAITGAQMNKQEEGRILAQIPGMNDKPNVWRAKARQTRTNLGDLANRIKGKRPGMGAGAGNGAGGTVRMRAPDGRALNVPADKVQEMEAAGAKRE